MYWDFDPDNNLEMLYNEGGVSRLYRTTFWQKVVDLYRYLIGGKSSLLNIETTDQRSTFPIRFVFDIQFNGRFGLLDFPLIPLKLLAIGGAQLYDKGIDIFNAARIYPIILEILLSAFGGMLIGIGSAFVLLHQLVSFVLTSIITILSLPIIGVIHLKAKSDLRKMDNDFAKKYAAQNTDSVEAVSLKENGDEYRLEMKDIYVLLNNPSVHLSSSDRLRVGSIKNNSEALHKRYPRNRLVLLGMPNPHILINPAQPPMLLYFYKFNYTAAGLAAFRELRRFNPTIVEDPYAQFNIAKDPYAQKRDKNITRMLLAYSTLAQMVRNPEQRVFGKGEFLGYFNQKRMQVKQNGSNQWVLTGAIAAFASHQICIEWHDIKNGVFAYYRDGYDESIDNGPRLLDLSPSYHDQHGRYMPATVAIRDCHFIGVNARRHDDHIHRLLAKDPIHLAPDAAVEIAINTIDDADLSLEDRRFILQGMRKSCIDKYYSNMFKAAESSPRVEEVVDDVAYDNAAYVRYTK